MMRRAYVWLALLAFVTACMGQAPVAPDATPSDLPTEVAGDSPVPDAALPMDRPPAPLDLPVAPDAPDVGAPGDASPTDLSVTDLAPPDAASVDAPTLDRPADTTSDVLSQDRPTDLGLAPDVAPDASAPDAPADALRDVAPDAGATDAPADLPRDGATDLGAPDGACPVPTPDGGVGRSVGSTDCLTAPRFTAGFTLTDERPPFGRATPRLPLGCQDPVWEALHYRVVVGPGQTVSAVARSANRGVLVQVQPACGSNLCNAQGLPDALWTNTSAASVEVVVQVIFSLALTAAASADLTVSLFDGPATACAAAPRLTPGVALPEQTLSGTATAPLCGETHTEVLAAARAPVREPRLYRVTVPPWQTLRATATSVVPGANVALALRATCGFEGCVGLVNAAPSPAQTLVYPNHAEHAQELVLAVGGSPAGAPLRFTLSATLSPAATVPCTTEAGSSFPNISTEPPSTQRDGRGLFHELPMYVRRARLGAGRELRVVGGAGPSDGPELLRGRVTCPGGTCFAPPAGRTTVVENRAAAAVEVSVGLNHIGRNADHTCGDYASTSPTNTSVAAALEVTLPFMGNAHPDQDLYFLVSVPPRSTLLASHISGGPLHLPRLNIQFYACCSPASCAAVGERRTDTSVMDYPYPEVTFVANGTDRPRPIVVVVGAGSGWFALGAQPSPANNVCEGAADLAPGATLTVPNTAYCATRVATRCGTTPGHGYATDMGARYYRVTVPARQWLRVHAVGAWDSPPTVELFASCADRALLACTARPTASVPLIADWQNTSDAPRTVYVATGNRANVDPPFPATNSNLRLTATLSAARPSP